MNKEQAQQVLKRFREVADLDVYSGSDHLFDQVYRRGQIDLAATQEAADLLCSGCLFDRGNKLEIPSSLLSDALSKK